MLGLDSMGRRYGCRPSQVVGEEDEHLAFAIDFWAHNYGIQEEDRLRREAVRNANRQKKR